MTNLCTQAAAFLSMILFVPPFPASTLLARAHDFRRDMRRLAENQSPALEILRKKTDVFVSIGKLVSALNLALSPNRRAEQSRVEALQRSADGLDFDYPLKWQPAAIQGFFEIAAQATHQMSTR